MKKYIKPEIKVVDLKAGDLLETNLGVTTSTTPQGYDKMTEGQGSMAKKHSFWSDWSTEETSFPRSKSVWDD